MSEEKMQEKIKKMKESQGKKEQAKVKPSRSGRSAIRGIGRMQSGTSQGISESAGKSAGNKGRTRCSDQRTSESGMEKNHH